MPLSPAEELELLELEEAEYQDSLRANAPAASAANERPIYPDAEIQKRVARAGDLAKKEAIAYIATGPGKEKYEREQGRNFDTIFQLGTGLNPLTAGLGETVVQRRRVNAGEQPEVLEGEIVKAQAQSMIPFKKARGIASTIKNALMQGGGGIVAEEARSAIDGGPSASVATSGGIPAAIAAVSPMLGRLAGKFTGHVDPADAAKVSRERLNNAEKDAILETMRRKGAVVSPSAVNPSLKNQVLESAAGIQNLEAHEARINQPVFNEMGRREASLSGTAPINEAALKQARAEIAKPWNEARALGFEPEVNRWRDSVTKQQGRQKELSGNYTIEGEEALLAQKQETEQALADLTAKLRAAGRPDLATAVPEAQVRFAKNFDVADVTPTGTGDVSPAGLSQMAASRGEGALTGELREIAQFNNAFGRSSKNVNRVATAPGAATSGAALVTAASAGSPAQASLGILPFLRSPIAKYILSPEYQAKNAVRNYTVPTSADPAVVEAITRFMVNKQRVDDQKGRGMRK